MGPPEDSECFYVIKKGDNLSIIAKKYKTTADELARINCIKDKNLIYEGEEIIAYENCGYD